MTENVQEKLGKWLAATLPGGTIVSMEQIHTGTSNLMFRIGYGGKLYALRRPPLVGNDPTSNNLTREITLLSALRASEIVHPRLVASCTDVDIIGAPFLLSEWVDGFTPVIPFPEPFASDPHVRRAMAFALIDGLAQVANADWKKLGLGTFGKPEGFLERQVDRWLAQLGRYTIRTIPHLDTVAKWLREKRKPTPRQGLLHGDFSFANVMFRKTQPAQLAAIVDWESATIGDPLLDLGHLLSGWDAGLTGWTWASFVPWGNGFPTREEMAARYAERTGLPIDGIAYYQVLALFKLAIIMEGAYYRHATGASSHPMHKAMETEVPGMIREAAAIAEAD